jgi:hypothetical protein
MPHFHLRNCRLPGCEVKHRSPSGYCCAAHAEKGQHQEDIEEPPLIAGATFVLAEMLPFGSLELDDLET